MKLLQNIVKPISKRFELSWTMIFVPLFALLINIILSEAQNVFGIKSIIISIVFLSALLGGIILVYKHLFLEQTDKYIMPKLEVALSQPLVEATFNDHIFEESIITDRKLSEYEKNCSCEEIWVISNDLSTEIDGGLYADIVPDNLRRGIKYKVFVADGNTLSMRIEQLKRKNDFSSNIEYYVLDDEFFFLVARFDFTIYDPYKTAASGRRGYIGLDLPDSDELIAAKVNDDLVDAIASKLLEYIQKNSAKIRG